MLKRALTVFLLVLALAAGQATRPAAAVENLVNVPNDDPEMAAAIAKARALQGVKQYEEQIRSVLPT